MTLPPSCRWSGDHLELLDQRQLPGAVVFMQLHRWQEVAEAISSMAVRGAPAIGIAAAWGVVLAARSRDDLPTAIRGLRASRPTAVNLGWALNRMQAAMGSASPVDVDALAGVAALMVVIFSFRLLRSSFSSVSCLTKNAVTINTS